MKSILNEIGGLTIRRVPPIGPMPATNAQINSRAFSGSINDIMPLCSKMDTWQRNIMHDLIVGKKDIYIAASPGAGKTLPYMCYWLQEMLNLNVQGISNTPKDKYLKIASILLNKPELLPKLVILVPIRSLAHQTVNEFRMLFGQVIGSFLSNLLFGLLNEIQQPGNNPPPPIDMTAEVNLLLKAVHPALIRLISERNQNLKLLNDTRISGDFERAKTYENLINQNDKDIRHVMVEGIENIVTNQRGNYSLVALRTGLGPEGDPVRAPVTIGIYESAPRFIDPIASKIKLLVCDESHLIQEQEKKIRDSARAYNIAGSLYHILGKIKNTDCRVLFLSGTANPGSATNLVKYLNLCFGRTFNEKVEATPGGNRSSVAIVADDSIASDNTLLNIIKSGNPGTVIVVFSKRKINDLAEKSIRKINPRSLEQVQQGTYQQRTHKSVLGNLPSYTGKASSRPNLDYKQIGQQASTTDMTASHIADPLLRQAVQSGFGYIYRLDEHEKNYEARKHDNEIVAELFSQKKIRVLLSTDAIGIGVNVKVGTLIIPSIDKPTGGGRREQMDPATLAQLLHRAGRGAFDYAKIVTTDQNMARVSHALSLTPGGFTPGSTIQNFPAGACRMINFFVDLWGSI